MNRLLYKTSFRFLQAHPWQIALCVLGVALGVAVVVAIDLANASARTAFTLSTESIAGRATHQISGGPAGLDEALYRQLRVDAGLREIAPLVDGYANLCPGGDCQNAGRSLTVRVLGVDPFAETPFRSYLGGGTVDSPDAEGNLTTLLTDPATVLMSADTAARYGIVLGSVATLQVGDTQREVRVVGLLRPSDATTARVLESLLICDIATGQELLGMVGRLSRIDLILPDDASVRQLEALLPPGAVLERPASRSGAIEQMTRAFELNLSALSLLALIVGMFLIYNTITFSVVQRRTLIGTLRCIGVSRPQIFALVLTEALLISLVGVALGLGLGILLARSLVGLVTQTINDLYFVLTVRGLSIEPLALLKGAGLGVLATLAAAAVPAVEATLTPPRSVLRRSSMEERYSRAAPWAALGGALMLAAGGALLALPTRAIEIAFVALFAIVIGCALLVPGITIALMALVRPLLGKLFGLLGRMAARDVIAALSRTSVAIAALMIAVSVTIGVGIMVGSFRTTVIRWLDQSLQADIYLSAPSNTANRVDSTLDPAVVEALGATPGVMSRTTFRNVQVETPAGPTQLVALNSDSGRSGAQPFVSGDPQQIWQAFYTGAIIVSEPFSYRTGLGAGDELRLRTDRGEQAFPIAGVFYDYTSDRGVIFMDRALYDRYWDDRGISSFALYVDQNTDPDTLVQQLRERASTLRGANGSPPLLVINSNRSLRVGTLAIFDRTFAITGVLQLLATIVAFVGILSALMALQLERARELGVLRATGLTPRQLWAVVLSQTGLMGLTAGLLAMPVGLALALVLVYVINRRSFGWTLQLELNPALFAQALLLALLAALLAGIYPAFKMSRTSPALALREE